MVFNSIGYVIFFPIVLICYYVVPQKLKNTWLLLASYVFYGIWNVKYCVLLFFCTLVTYIAGLAISADGEKEISKAAQDEACRVSQEAVEKTQGTRGAGTTSKNPQKSKWGGYDRNIFLVALIISFGILCIFKYTDFAIKNFNYILGFAGIEKGLETTGIVLPIGISFFTFQSVGYLIDVYKKKYKAERSFISYALFVSFFPQILSGPIGRGGKLLPQYNASKKLDTDNLMIGAERFVWGLFLKLVIADRAGVLVNTVYNDYNSYAGVVIIFATIIYGLQIYADFDGYTHMAIGSAKMLGIDIPENFDTPYLSTSIKEFWHRWHISLSTWLRDYVYISAGGGRVSKARKYFNIMLTFFVSGIWHGSKWSFVVWGLLHGTYQIVGDVLMPFRTRLCRMLRINTEAESFKAVRMFITFALADFAWLFFRADGLRNAFRMIKRIIFELHPSGLMEGKIYNLGLDEKNFRLLIYAAITLFIVDICKYKGIDLKKKFREQNWLFKELAFVTAILFIIVFGWWGGSYNAASFIYSQF